MKNKKIILLFTTILLAVSCGRKTSEVKPQRKNIVETVFASGVLEPDNKYNLTAQTEGYITALNFEQGDTVMQGTVMAVIDNRQSIISSESAGKLLELAENNTRPEGPLLRQAAQNVTFQKEKYLHDSAQYERFKRLLSSNSVSKIEFENARLAFEASSTAYLNSLENLKLSKQQAKQQFVTQRAQRDISSEAGGNNQLKAVFGGKVYKRLKEKGDYVRRGEVIAVIGDPASLYARLSVDENNIAKVKIGQKAVIQLNTEKDRTYNAKITEIYPAFDEATQSFYCKARFVNEPSLKIAGSQLQANIVIGEKSNALVIPKSFLTYGNKVKLKSKEEVSVSTGFISGDYVEILSGIDENTVIVTDQLK
jgi:multidrug efflux pump subunit AcrA (membrane-fusion protein)